MVAAGSMLGKFRIDGILGRGASSVVFRAHNVIDDRVVALKALREELLADGERDGTLQRFAREARIGLTLRHPCIVRLWEAGDLSGVPYIAMELVEGEALDAHTKRGVPIEPAIACALIAKILDALDYAHRASVIHRDVKPANIVLRRPQGDPVLMDFGIARLGGSDVTQVGEVLGTPSYMSPEQLRGAVVDLRTDLHSVGVILYQLATGKRPFSGSVAEVMHQICTIDPVPPSALVPGLEPLDPIIARALAKAPSGRFASAADFALALRGLAFDRRTAQPAAVAPAAAPSPSGPATLADLERVLQGAVAAGVDETGLAAITALLNRLGQVDGERFGRLCLDHGIVPLAEELAATASRPGRKATARGHWLSGVELAALLQSRVHHPAARAAGEAALADLAFRVAGIFLTYSSDLSSRLAAEDAPDLGILALDFLLLDTLMLGLDALGATRESRIAEASSRVMVAQVLRRAARVIENYIETGDPMARFDVVAMLVQVEDLIALALRLTGQEGTIQVDPVAELCEEAVRRFLLGVTGLVKIATDELTQALSSDDPAAVADFVNQLKQLRLIYQFAMRLEGASLRDLLAALTGGIYQLFGRAARSLTSGARSEQARRQAEALYEMAAELGWKDLANHLLTWIRRSVLS